MPRLLFSLLRRSTVFFCLVLSMTTMTLFAETITVPFGWTTGQIRNYQVSSQTERLGNLQGGNCTLNGRLRVEVLKREGKSAHLRFQLSALKFEDSCVAPSLHQVLWLRLSETSLDAVLEPEAGNVTLPNLNADREKIFASLENTPLLFGRSVSRETQQEISKEFRKFLFANATIVAQATGFINELGGAIGEVYEMDTTSSLPTTLPSPFGGEPLPGVASITVKSGAKDSGEFSIRQVTRYEPKEYKEAFTKLVRAASGEKMTKSDLEALEKRNITAGSVTAQRIELRTGWIIDAESTVSAQVGAGMQVLTVKMLYQSSAK